MNWDEVPRGMVIKDIIGTNMFEAITFTEWNRGMPISLKQGQWKHQIEKSRPNCTNKWGCKKTTTTKNECKMKKEKGILQFCWSNKWYLSWGKQNGRMEQKREKGKAVSWENETRDQSKIERDLKISKEEKINKNWVHN